MTISSRRRLRRIAAARRYALAIVAWRRRGDRWTLAGLPARYRGDGRWVLRHLIDPRDRARARAQYGAAA